MSPGTRKANGSGHTYKVGSSYKTVIRNKGQVVTASSKSVQESKRLAKEKVLALPHSINGSLLRKKISLGEFLLPWLEQEHQHQIAHTTYRRYHSIVRTHINPLLGKYLLTELNPRIITWFLSQMRTAGQSPRSQQQARALLSIALRAAEEQELIDSNPIRKVRTPQNKENSFEPLSLEEVKRLLKMYKGTFLSARLHIALLCGLRQGEALGLRWQDINFESATLKVEVQIQKINGSLMFTTLKTTRSKRLLVLNRETLMVLEKHRQIIQNMRIKSGSLWNEMDLVFPRGNGLPRSAKTDHDQWQSALKLCEISPRRLHDARHTAATLLYSQGVGIETISRALGHSSSAITSRLYVHSAEEPMRKAAEAMDAIFK